MTSSSKGRFIVIEGIDGCGGETQSKKLVKHLREKKIPVKFLTYPDYKGPIGHIINEYLYKKYNFSTEVQFMLYFSDFLKDKDKIQKWLKEGNTIIADRYFSSTLAYQCASGFLLDTALQVSTLFHLPRPDLIIFLNISAETSMARKKKEKEDKLDRHEENKKFLTELAECYKNLAQGQIFSRWVIVDGERPIDEVFRDLIRIGKL